ncbi:MAG: hypothetical protein ABI114_04785 [Rhodanobacter sp.]
MNVYLLLGFLLLLACLGLAAGWAARAHRRQAQHTRSLQTLLDLADQLEADLKTCRAGLQEAYAIMSSNPDRPAASEQEARHAIDAGLRSLLQQRLWVRDRAAHASQAEMEAAAASMRGSQARLAPLLQALTQAQTDLNSAMREHIRSEPME